MTAATWWRLELRERAGERVREVSDNSSAEERAAVREYLVACTDVGAIDNDEFANALAHMDYPNCGIGGWWDDPRNGWCEVIRVRKYLVADELSAGKLRPGETVFMEANTSDFCEVTFRGFDGDALIFARDDCPVCRQSRDVRFESALEASWRVFRWSDNR